ncbi:MAG: GerMN domain-containing protein [Armatimonadetes bacterium]|nr:GerMN domain-containing protein [Armatimonadota bacterium]MDE2207066.1 GerMN domain-containing protein [Armatimonadota bacterium]
MTPTVAAPASKSPTLRGPSSAQAALQAVSRLLQADAASANPHFPTGTRVERVRVHRGIATIQFNRAFAHLADMGESNESLVQHALQVALSNTPGVSSMRVRVGDGPFRSDVTDWDTPFPVRGVADDESSDSRSGHNQ